MDIFAYDNIADGMNHLARKSSVFEELFQDQTAMMSFLQSI